jgi:hypothetical protein
MGTRGIAVKSALLAMALVVASACTFIAPVECDDRDLPEWASCEEVLAVAGERLPDGVGITRLTAQRGIHCPYEGPVSCPDAPVVTVYADLIDGRHLYVSVRLDGDGSVRAEPARAVEPAP